MRNIRPRILVLSALFMAWACAATIVPVVTPALADPDNPASYRAEFERIKQEMKELWLEMHNFQPLPRYCLPPIEPLKAPHNTLMQVFDARTRALVARYLATKQSLSAFLAGNYRLETEFMIDGLSPRDRRYWQNSPFEQEKDRLQRKFNEKDAELKAKRERRCGGQAPKTEAIIGGNPPVESTEPGIALPAVQVRDAAIPALPPRLCSQAEKQALLEQFWAANNPLYMNYQDAREYEAAIGDAMREKRGNNAALAALRPGASAQTKRHAKVYDDFQRAYDAAKAMQIENCGGETKKEIGALPGSAGASVAVAGAVGELTIPKKPYLSLEVGGNQYLGVVDHERTATVAALLIGLTYDLDFLPELKFGDVRRHVWRATAELSDYDFDVHARGGSIATTTEGVGIPGTGDLSSMFPSGVFFANPAFNDVTDIAYRHTSDFQGLSLGLEQKSFYDCGAITLGAGLSYTRLETSDILSGRVDGFLTDFRYLTDIETRNFGLFVHGGAEVPLDDFWDSALRYAGEFSGFRVAANAKAGVNFLDAEGIDRLDLTGFVNDAQRVAIGKDDTTFSYQLGVSLNYTPPGAKALNIALGFEYGESDTHPVANRSGELNDVTRIEFETQEELVGTLRTRFTF